MGKKNKNKQFDYFNMSPEEQMANAEMFNNVEKGEASILDALNLKVNSAPVAQSDYRRQIEEACFGMTHSNNTNEDDAFVSEVERAINNCTADTVLNNDEDDRDNTTSIDVEPQSSYIPNTTVVEETIECKETVVSVPDTGYNPTDCVEAPTDNIARIHFRYEPAVGKVFIEDGLVSTPVSIYHASSIELDQDKIPDDSDAFGHLMSRIFYYIITCKHPAVIMSEEVFNIEFSMFARLNFNRFAFFKNNGFVYVYVIDECEYKNFYSITDILKLDDNGLLRYAVSAAYAANTIHNIFMYDDSDEVESVMEVRHAVKELMKLIEADPDTEYAGHQASGDVMKRMRVNDLHVLVADVHATLEDLLVYEDEEDDDADYDDTDDDDTDDTDDDDDDYEDDDDDVDVNDFPDIDLMTNTDDIDAMLEEAEATEEIVSKVETTVTHKTTTVIDNGDEQPMVVPVFHRRQ